MFDLRHDDTVQTISDNSDKVAVSPIGGEGIDPHIEFSCARLGECFGHGRAGCGFFRDGYGVFQVENDAVGGQGQGFFDTARVVAGGEEQASHCATFLALCQSEARGTGRPRFSRKVEPR